MTAGGRAKVTSPLVAAVAFVDKLPVPMLIKLAQVMKHAASVPARFENNLFINGSLNGETTLSRLWVTLTLGRFTRKGVGVVGADLT
jgi:hypothetical protein